jgi:HEAT repeat protein
MTQDARNRKRYTPTLLVATLVVTLLVAIPGWLPRSPDKRMGEPEAEIQRLLDESHAPARRARALRGLVSLGEDGLGPLYSAWVTGSIEARELTDDELELVYEALLVYGPNRLGPFLLERYEKDGPASELPSAVELLGDCGEGTHLRTLTRLAGSLDPVTATVRARYESAARALLRRDPSGFARLTGLWREVPDPLREELVRAVGATEDSRGLEFLSGILGEDERLDEPALLEIQRLAHRTVPPVAPTITAPIRRQLLFGSTRHVMIACDVLGAVEDEEAVPLLVDLLDSGSRGVSAQVVRALQSITRLSFRTDPERWRAWYDAELAWYAEHASGAYAALESGKTEEVLNAIQALAKRKLQRHTLATELVYLLSHDDLAIRTTTCQALAQIGSPVAVPALVDALHDADDALVRHALSALTMLTGEDHPAESPAWRALVDARS